MNLEELKRLCDEAPPGPWPLYYEVCPNEYGGGCPTLPPSDCDFIAAARTYMPKLIAVAEEAKKLTHKTFVGDIDSAHDLVVALAVLESK